MLARITILFALSTLPVPAAWVKVHDQIGFDAIQAVTDKILVASGYQSTYRSTDGGASWATVNAGAKTCFLEKDGVLFAGSVGQGIWSSKDSGLTWNSVYTYQGKQNVFAITEYKGRLIAGTDGGVYFSDNNGLKWTNARVGNADSVYTLATDDTTLLLTTKYNSYQSSDSGKTWTTFQGNASRFYLIFQGVIYGGSENYGLSRSVDKGKTWESVFLGSNYKSTYFLAEHKGILYTGNSQGILFSPDNGSTWTEFSSSAHSYYTGRQIIAGDYIYYTPNVGPDYGEFRCAISELLAKSESERLGPDSTLWLQTKGPPGGAVTAFAEFNDGLFAGSPDGVFRTADGGVSWAKVFRTGSSLAANEKFLFAGGVGIYRNLDLTRNWTNVTASGGTANSTLKMIGPTLYAGGNMEGVSWSGTDGESWGNQRDGLESYFVTSFDTIGGELQVGSTGGLYRYNSGKSYVSGKDNPPYWIRTGSLGQISCMGSNKSKHFIGTLSGLYEMKDTAIGWKPVSDSALAKGEISSLFISGDAVFAGTSRLFRSMDNGESWKSLPIPGRNPKIRSIYAYKGALFVGLEYGGLLRSADNGETWVAVNAGMSNSDIRCLRFFGGVLYASDFNGGVYKSPDNGDDWIDVSAGLPGNPIFALEKTVNGLYAAVFDKGVYQLNEAGTGWVPRSVGLKDTTSTTLASIGNTLFVGTRGGAVYRSPDPGAGWTAGTPPNGAINGLTSSGQRLYAATSKGAYYSDNNAATWALCGTQARPSRELAVFGNTLVASTDSGLYRSKDHGATWTMPFGVNANTPQVLARIGNHLVVSVSRRNSGGNYFGEVYQSTDTGATWVRADSGLYREANYDGVTAFAANGDYYFAGTRNHGVWRRPLSYLGAVRVNRPPRPAGEGIQLRIKTRGGHSRVLSIEFKLPHEGDVTIRAIDFRGRRFDISNGKTFSPGWQSIQWDSGKLASGRFVVQVRAGGLSKSRTLILY